MLGHRHGMSEGPRFVGHLDMDAFFAAVEQLDDPTLRGRPVIVGGLGPRGVVSTASYEARTFGIHSAMPTALARRRCPDGAYLRPRFARYKEISDRVRDILCATSPVVETISLDEAFFELSGCATTWGEAAEAARRVKLQVHEETRLTCSVGVASNRFLAKIASELGKPDGFLVIEPANVQRLLDPLPVGRVWGVGEVTERRLSGLGLLRVRDLRLAPLELLAREFGSTGARLQALARGEDDTPLAGQTGSRTISREVTYSYDLVDPAEIESEVRALARDVAAKLREESLLCHTVRVKIRYPDFRTITRQLRLGVGQDSSGLIEQFAVHLLRTRVRLDEGGVRLLGVGVGQLSEATARQLPLFD
jgi:DNA polymerase-4